MSIERMNMPAFHPEVPTAYEYIDGQCNTYPQTPLVPQTFGEELSYYETLVLMNKKINEIIDSINSGATLNVETTTTSTTADYATNAGTATSTNYANKSSVAKCSERASVAEYANEAGSAKKADRATIADNVTHSSTSDYATTAGSSSTATTATYATSAGYANSCNNADEADEADYATNAGKLNGHSASYYVANPMTTAGDIIVSGNGGTPNRLAKGEDGQVLTMSNGSVAWATGSGSGEPNQYLKNATANGNTLTITRKDDTTLIYTPTVQGMTNPMTTSGDIIVGGTNGTPTRLPKGTSGKYLRISTDGSALEWGYNNIVVRGSGSGQQAPPAQTFDAWIDKTNKEIKYSVETELGYDWQSMPLLKGKWYYVPFYDDDTWELVEGTNDIYRCRKQIYNFDSYGADSGSGGFVSNAFIATPRSFYLSNETFDTVVDHKATIKYIIRVPNTSTYYVDCEIKGQLSTDEGFGFNILYCGEAPSAYPPLS